MAEKRPSRTVQFILALSTILILAFGIFLLLLPETQESTLLQISAGIFLALGAIDLLALLVMRSSSRG